jgi:hypothetical protein
MNPYCEHGNFTTNMQCSGILFNGPITNVREEKYWMLRVLESSWSHTLNKFSIMGDENDIYMVELSQAFSIWGS